MWLWALSWLLFIQPLVSTAIQFNQLFHYSTSLNYPQYILKCHSLELANLKFWCRCCTQNLFVTLGKIFSKVGINPFYLSEINVNLYWLSKISKSLANKMKKYPQLFLFSLLIITYSTEKYIFITI